MRLRAFAITLAIVVCLALAGWRYLLVSDPFSKQRFSKEAWLSISSDNQDKRAAMTQDLIDSKQLMGRTEKSVLSLLGKPNGTESRQDGNNLDWIPEAHVQKLWIYYLGAWSGLRIDMDNLYIGYDASGKVVGAWIVQT